MVERAIRTVVTTRLEDYPAVAISGPRQCGKTTLARSIGGAYYDLEQESDRLRLDLEWTSLTGGSDLVILDEAQADPPVFPRLRAAIDAAPRAAGRFLLLGSVSPSLMHQVSESLAGRLSIVEMGPFLLREIPEVTPSLHWLTGGYPEGGILLRRRFPQWQLDYLTLLAQRDLPAWGLASTAAQTQRLLRMTAAVHGQTWNATQIGQSLGVSYHTVEGYLDYLEGAYLVRRLVPYQANLRKRLSKRSRLYWRDTGLLHALLGVSDQRDLIARPWVGASWEGYVIEQIIGSLGALDVRATPSFFRTSDLYEVDLLLDFGGRMLWAVEVKLTAHPTRSDMARLEKSADLVGADLRILVSQVRQTVRSGRSISCDLPWLLANLDGLARPAPA
jgi:hypothetical protein